jgi:hypothetical protein
MVSAGVFMWRVLKYPKALPMMSRLMREPGACVKELSTFDWAFNPRAMMIAHEQRRRQVDEPRARNCWLWKAQSPVQESIDSAICGAISMNAPAAMSVAMWSISGLNDRSVTNGDPCSRIRSCAFSTSVPDINGTAYWHDSTGMLGSHALLDGRRSGDEAT